jgi:crotonobetainyl-CoA:carnitine CoA-transferase CaiB-like acyl-CoA transferase
MLVATMVAALVRKRKTGKGVYIDAAGTEAALYGCFEACVLEYLVNGREQTRMGNRHPYAAPHGAYLCQGGDFPPAKLPALEMKDRWCAIAVFTDEEWQRFCKVIGEPAWTKDPKFATLASRKQNEDELDRLVGQWTRDYSAEEVMYLMQAGGVAAGVVQTNQDLSEDAQLRHRGHWVLLDHKEIGPSYYNNYGWRLSKTPAQHKPVPLLGEHNEYVLRNFLGMSDEEIAEMAAARIFEARLTG